MIAFLEGKIRSVGSGWVVLQIGGIGYKIFTVGNNPMVGEEISLHIFDYIREDRRELFGFIDIETSDLFQRLIDISGVGPRLAQKILGSNSREEITDGILRGDIDFLTRISGVGKKTAQKIILELQGVLVSLEPAVRDNDTLDALVSLGYKERDVVDLVNQLTAESFEDRVKEALRLLSK